ncbi:MAG: hypothetical protein NTZ55_02365 [Candidatus Roizmanbacteria bacterium]|nr:hypothetical protein [Candidatus Roizmanbacteria bacterium]
MDDLTGQFNIWNGEPYSQSNPRRGGTNWFLPPGTYYMNLSAPGYNSAISTIFSLTESKVISIEAKMEKWNFWGLLGATSQFEVVVPASHDISEKNLILGKKFAWLNEKGWEGKDSLISIIPFWDPSAAARFSSLSMLANQQIEVPNIVIVPGANTSTVELLKNRGRYASTFIADPDGNSLEEFKDIDIPLTVRVNRKGIIVEVVILK